MTSKLFKRFIASYLLISMLPVLFGYLTYQQAISRARDKTYSLFQTMVEKTASEIAGVFAEVQSCANRLSVDPSVLALLRARPTQDDPGTTFRMFDARQALARNKIFNNSLIDIALYCESPDVVVTTTHVFISIDRYYDLFFKYRDFSLPRFLALLPEGRMGDRYLPAAPIMVRTGADTVSQSESILFVRNIRTPPHHAKLIAQISMDALSAPIGSLLQEYEGFMVVLDENGNRLATFGDAPEDAAYLQAGGPLTLSGKRMFVTGESTEQNGWRYVAGLSERAVLSDVNMLTFSVLTILLIQVALLFALAFVFTRQNVKPVQSIMALVGDNAPPSYGVDEYDYIQRMVTLLKENNRRIQNRLHDQLPLLRERFFTHALGGAESPLPGQSQEELGISAPPGEAVLAVLRIELGPALISHTQLELLRMMLKEFCLGYKREQLTLCPMDPEHAAIVFFTQRREESSRALVESLHEMLLERGAPVPLIAVSMHPGPLSARYARAVTQLNRWDARPGAAIWMPEDAPQKSDRMWYPIKVEERLIQQIKSGDASAVRQSLERISVQNFQERNLGPVMQRSLVRAFEHTMERVLEESQIHAPSTALRRESPMEDFESWCLSMAGETERLRQLSGARQMEPVYAYLKENYSDNQLSLGGMARHFGFSETYFSRMFKTQAGINYSEYVERLRIEKAREMLCSHHTVDEIAGAVGYNSVSVFRSAFKRVTGETPSAYKAHISS